MLALALAAALLAGGGTAGAAATAVHAVDVAEPAGLGGTGSSWSANVGDFDADGRPDLLLSRHHQQDGRLLRNLGGRFGEIAVGLLGRNDRHDCAWGDVDADGRLDAFCTAGGDTGIGTGAKQLWMQHADGTFTNEADAYGVVDPYGRGRHATFVDVNHDRWPDLFVNNNWPRDDGVPTPNRLYLNEGGVRFREAPELGMEVEEGGGSKGCAWAADYDGDGWQDLLFCGRDEVHLYRNEGGVRFRDVTAAARVAGGMAPDMELADVNGDGALDLVEVFNRVFQVQLGRGDGTFAPPSAKMTLQMGRWLAVGDVNADRVPDVYVLQSCTTAATGELVDQPDVMLVGAGDGTFTRIPTPHAGAGCGDEVSPIDHDGNGLTDFVVLNGKDKTPGPTQLVAFLREGEVRNTAPAVTAAAVDAAAPATDAVVTATATASDPDGDPVSLRYQWLRNGVPIAGATGATLDLGAPGAGDRGDRIQVRVVAGDGRAESDPVTSPAAVVADTAPAAVVSLAPRAPLTNGTLTATAAGVDRDGDSVTFTYEWRVDGELRRSVTTAAGTDVLDLSLPGFGDAGQVVAVTVVPSDGELQGAPALDSVTVANRVPTVRSVTLDPASPRTADVVSADVVATDPDGDPLTIKLQWFRNGTAIAGATKPTLDLRAAGAGDRGDAVTVRAIANDGRRASAARFSDPAVVADTAPVAAVTLAPRDPAAGAAVTATVEASDADRDPVSLRYVWTVEGTAVRDVTTAARSDELTPAGAPGARVTVTVTPADDALDGEPVADVVTVADRAPVVDAIAIAETAARTDDVLHARGSASDPDGQPASVTFQWLRNGEPIAGATGAALDLSAPGAGGRGDAIAVRAVAHAGGATGAAATSAPLVVGDTAPTATVTMAPRAPANDGTVTAAVAVRDADGDPVSLRVEWRVAGAVRRAVTTAGTGDTLDLAAVAATPGDSVAVTVVPDDGALAGAPASDAVTVADRPPAVSPLPDRASVEEEAVTIRPDGRDPDRQPLAWSATGLPAGVSIDAATGAIAGAPPVGAAGRYTVTVRAVAGGLSAAASFVWDVASTVPAVPAGLAASPTSTGVDLAWTAGREADLRGYHVYRSAGAGWSRITATPVAQPLFTDAAAPLGALAYRVTAVDTAGHESPAAEVAARRTFALRSTASAARDTRGDLVLPRPADVAAGDLLLATVVVSGSKTTPPSGWTTVRSFAAGGLLHVTYWKVATAADPAGWTWSSPAGDASAGVVLALRGASSATPVANVSAAATTGTSLAAPSVTTTAPGSLVVGIWATAAATPLAPPADMTRRDGAATSAAARTPITLVVADAVRLAAGATGTRTATAGAAAAGVAQLVALTPAA